MILMQQMMSRTSGAAKIQLSTEMCFLCLLPSPLNPNLKTVRNILNHLLLLGQRESLEQLTPKAARNPLHVVRGLASGSPPATEAGVSEQFSRLPHIKCTAAVESGGTKSTDPLGPLIKIGKFLLPGCLGQPKLHLITALQTRWRPAFKNCMCTEQAAHKAEMENWLPASEFPSTCPWRAEN